ncbi:DUF3040 domain-containing protein [Arthrobacter sp. 31Y]|uniref:DUF3040 domain-containing protein n=1 Tax=Arthrobacter sp. 31Y TaxID=1115632 RepID=UPI00046389AE|nr:DUF3040 domain-containing protein [Arthrobacter sp. 31Y]
MSLSDEERKSLEELERDLALTDPDLAYELKSGRPRGAVARNLLGSVAVLAGFVMVIVGIVTQLVILGVVGFLLASGGAYWLLAGTSLRRRTPPHDDDPAP